MDKQVKRKQRLAEGGELATSAALDVENGMKYLVALVAKMLGGAKGFACLALNNVPGGLALGVGIDNDSWPSDLRWLRRRRFKLALKNIQRLVYLLVGMVTRQEKTQPRAFFGHRRIYDRLNVDVLLK